MFWLKSTGLEWEDSGETIEGRKTKHKSFYRGRPWKGRGKQFVEEGLPQVLKRQMEKQLNQVQGNCLVISSNLKTFIKTLTKVRQTKRGRRVDVDANNSSWKDRLKFKVVSQQSDLTLKSEA